MVLIVATIAATTTSAVGALLGAIKLLVVLMAGGFIAVLTRTLLALSVLVWTVLAGAIVLTRAVVLVVALVLAVV